MSMGLVYKSLREWVPLTISCGLFLFVVEGILAHVLPTFQGQFADQIVRIEFLRNILQSILGSEMTEQFGPDSFSAFPWVHPVVLIALLAHAIIGCTKLPAGEVDRGTIDLLMGLPISRWELLIYEWLVWLANAAIVLACMVVGNRLGSLGTPTEFQVPTGRMLIILANLASLYVAIGGVSWLASALCSRRATAMLVVFGIVLASILFNFLTPYWSIARELAFLGFLHYYRPLQIVRQSTWPTGDIGVLLAVGTLSWIAAGVWFSRRDLVAS
jgi:ABC-type transport system involved in multi-copper enzyme maturation permease subunit